MYSGIKMLRPFLIVLIVVLVKFHFGDGSGYDSSQFAPPLARALTRNRSGRYGGDMGYDNNGFAPSTYKMVITFDNGKQIEIPPDLFEDGENITESEVYKRLKKREEENDPLTHQINKDGVVIEQQLPTGGQIMVKISGSNINQRRMNKLRELMTNSINFVFEHTEFKSGLMSRII